MKSFATPALFNAVLALLYVTSLVSLSAQEVQQANSPSSITVRTDQPGIRVSPLLYGIFFEEINCAGDGGLYAELVRNRSFEDADKPEHWTLVATGQARGEMTIDTTRPMSSTNPNALKLKITEAGDGQVGVANSGFWGIPLIAGETYHFSMSARSGEGFKGNLTVSLKGKEGQVFAQDEIRGLTANWKTFTLALTPKTNEASARLVISAMQTGAVWLDMVSLFPGKTWKGRNHGLRPDLAEMLAGLRPGFVRFPGGCWVEGDTLKYAYRWKQTIGNPADRRNLYNIWQYFSTHGLGYHEYLQLCEDLGAEPLFVINVGMSHREVVPMERMGEWVQDALDAVEYANGPTNTVWGAMRTRNGHPAPFRLKYLEIGNENGGPAYQERYAFFYDSLKARYPDLKLISDVPTTLRPADIIDEHYYNNPGFFISHADQYDSYDRQGPKIYVGEYAVTQNCGRGNLRGALGEAAFMTGLERNSDIVIMASYAPLFANINYKRWNPDLINFNNSRVYGTPSYYVQKLFSENRPDRIVPVQVKADTSTPVEVRRGGIGMSTWNTQAEYKDIKVTQDDKVLLAHDFANGRQGWNTQGGNWQVKDGAFRQTADGNDRRAVAGDTSWTDYTYTLKARKISGDEGFLIMFQVQDRDNWAWWNIGGWGNSQHAIEQSAQGGKSTLGRAVRGQVETGRWYDVRVELKGARILCYLDGKLIHDVTPQPQKTLHAVAGRLEATGDLILKVVNVADKAELVFVQLQGAPKLQSKATFTTLTSTHPADENSIDEPTKVIPAQRTIDVAGSSFRYSFPANSLNILRFKAENR